MHGNNTLIQYTRRSFCPGRFLAPEISSRDSQADVFSLGGIIHLLLTGRLPSSLYDDNDSICLNPNKFQGLSSTVQDLLTEMLKKSRLQRIQLSDVGKHKWFTSETKNVLPACMRSGCEQYLRIVRWKSMIRAMDSKTETLVNQKKTYMSLSYSLDVDETGHLDRLQMQQLII